MRSLSAILSSLEPRQYGLCGLDAGGDWAAEFVASDGIKCHASHSGQCWLDVDGAHESALLSSGDLVLLPWGSAYRVYGGTAVGPKDAHSFSPKTWDGKMTVLNGGGECIGVGAYFGLAPGQIGELREILPTVIHIGRDLSGAVLSRSIALLMAEVVMPQFGSALIAKHLAQALLIEALRLVMSDAPGRASRRLH